MTTPVSAQLRPGRHIDRRQPHADRTHDQAGRGLVAAAHQDGAIDRMAAQELFSLHRQQIAIEHRRRLHEWFGQRHRRKFDRETTGLQHASLHIFRAFAQMRVAEIDVAPGIDDADDGLADPIGGVIAALTKPRTVAERTQIAYAEPAMAAQFFRTFTCGHSWRYAKS